MRIRIDIECENNQHFLNHLSVIMRDVKASAKKQKLIPSESEFDPGTTWTDSNCYGEHIVEILKEEDVV